MTARIPRILVMMVVGGMLIVLTFASDASVGAAIPDRAFQVMGCGIGDYACYYHRLGGAPSSSYCNNSAYTCTNGIPDTPPQYSTNVSPYCGDGGGAGCIDGSPLFVSTTTVPSNGSGLSTNVIVSSGFLNIGTSGTRAVNP